MKDNAIFLNEPLREESEFFARQKTQKHVHNLIPTLQKRALLKHLQIDYPSITISTFLHSLEGTFFSPCIHP